MTKSPNPQGSVVEAEHRTASSVCRDTSADGVRMLVIEDEVLLAQAMSRALSRRGYQVEWISDGADALSRLQTAHFDVVLLDIHMPDLDGYEFLKRLRRLDSEPVVLVVSGDDSQDAVVRTMRLGAMDFIHKPMDLDSVVQRIELALASRTIQLRIQRAAHSESMIAVSEAFRKTLSVARKVAQSNSSALIVGESGVGKEIVAGFIHESSKRANKPFVRVNVAAFPSAMVEAELFGSVRGAYTGSDRERRGLFLSADTGTLLLDELCELDIDLQPKLLRAVEQKCFFPIGSDERRDIDVRFLAATNLDPQVAIEQGRLRRDLFYRLSTVIIRIPPLRERVEDILPMAESFLQLSQIEHGLPLPQLTMEAKEALLQHAWPGNVRELRNVMDRAVLLAEDGQILSDDLRLDPLFDAKQEKDHITTKLPIRLEDAKTEVLERMERVQIRRALELSGGSLKEAATVL
ncbi:MAG: sigma-54 dependent transcriptional regulator, partial [Myxococcota bacterium]